MDFSTGLIFILTVLGIVFCYFQKQQENDDIEHKNSTFSSSSHQQSLHEVQEHGQRKDPPPPSSSSSVSLDKQCRRFSLDEIKLATHDFDDAFVIGKGGFGKVYKGKLDFGAGNDVAIKRLNLDSNQGAAEFWAEIEMLSKLRHSHIVSLLGYCEEEMILVYEYMPNGSLEDHLHKRKSIGSNFSPLAWVQRLNICIGAARGLDYLHTGTGIQCRVIHRDVKSSNILLDENWAGKISDFGLSRTGPAYQSRTTDVYTDQIRGTFGYMDMEYFVTHRLTRKSDVYAFGVVLFEVLCGRPAVDFTLDEQQHGLAGWAKHCVQEGTIGQIVDPCLRGQISSICLKEFAQIAYKCLLRSPKDRPTMAEVVARLEFVLALALRKHGGVTIVEKVWSFFSIKIPVQTKNYRNRQKWSNDNKSKQNAILEKAASTMVEGKSKGENNSIIIVDPTKAAAEVGSDNRNEAVATKEQVVTMVKECQMGAQKLKIFTFDELRLATRNFRPSAMLGVSDHESVYKGWVDSSSYTPSIPGSGIAVAVTISKTDNIQTLKEWQAEVDRGKFTHPNLVKLLGYCSEDGMLSLVYEFIPKRNLVNLLYGRPLQWGTTMKIAIGAAQGLAFLHPAENTHIHRTFSASNILLSEDYEAQIYFGSASMNQKHGVLPVFMSNALTSRYAPPEYMATGHWYVKSDVYAFGVMMLDMMVDFHFHDAYLCSSPKSLLEPAKAILSDNNKLMDPDYPPKGANKAANLILSCLEVDPENRPSMKQVVAILQDINLIKAA